MEKNFFQPNVIKTDYRLSDHFPLVVDSCKEEAAKFFYCFSIKGQQSDNHDKQAGRVGLAKCIEEMKIYDDCMVKAMKQLNK